jgi:hypothetical protein
MTEICGWQREKAIRSRFHSLLEIQTKRYRYRNRDTDIEIEIRDGDISAR